MPNAWSSTHCLGSSWHSRQVSEWTSATVVMTVEVAESFTDLRFSADLISFLSDDVIFQRYVEIEGQMHKVMTVIKMRGSAHSKDLRLYDVTETGREVGNTLYDYRGVITGVAQRQQASESGNSGDRPKPAAPGRAAT